MSARRTVTITGRPEKRFAPPPPPRALEVLPARPPRAALGATGRTPRFVQIERRRPRARAADRLAPRPDKVAMWAVVMALFLILVTVASSHAAV
jgi:hypothetical protein